MLSKKNSLPERIISAAMTLFGLSLIIIAVFFNNKIPHDILGIIKFIYSAVI